MNRGYRQPSDGRFIRFELHQPAPGRKTPTVEVFGKKSGAHEAVISWWGRRGFTLRPDDGTAFGSVCLGDVQRVIADLTTDWQAQRADAEGRSRSSERKERTDLTCNSPSR